MGSYLGLVEMSRLYRRVGRDDQHHLRGGVFVQSDTQVTFLKRLRGDASVNRPS